MTTSLQGAAGRRDAFDRLANEVGYDKVDFLWQQVVLDLIMEAERRGAVEALRQAADAEFERNGATLAVERLVAKAELDPLGRGQTDVA